LKAADTAPRGLKQGAWQIVAASTPERLEQERPDLWASGRVDAGESVGIPYAGKSLSSGSDANWKVRVWPARSVGEVPAGSGVEAASEWSAVGRFSIGLLNMSDWQASWITAREFVVNGRPRSPSWVLKVTKAMVAMVTNEIGTTGEPAATSEE
jgi:alpha-L-rhamnosidase